jgi:hypothetical protein
VSKKLLGLALACLFLLSQLSVLAWSPTGHMVIGEIAKEWLSKPESLRALA